MRKIVTIVLLAVASMANARDMSDQDINLMTASIKAVDTYKKVGMGGVFESVTDCYTKLQGAKKVAEKSVEFCAALDLGALFIDESASRAAGFPRDARFLDATVSNRAHAALTQFGISKSPAATDAYLNARAARIQRYVNRAAAQ